METLLKILAGIGLIVIYALVLALPTMLLWNWLMPDLFGLVEINFWQGLGITVLSGIFFKSSNNK
jgi:hypothetical protein